MGIFKTAMKAVAKKVAIVAAVFVGKKVLDKVMEGKARQPTKAVAKPAAKPKVAAKPKAAAKPKTAAAKPGHRKPAAAKSKVASAAAEKTKPPSS